MVHSTSPRPLVIIPHGDFENQVTQRLDDALTSGLIKQAKYRDLCNDLQWVLPFQQALFNIHLNDQIPSPQSHLSNSNVQPSSAASAIQFTVDIDPAANESGDYITTHDLDDEVPPSSVDILSSTPSPRQIPPPTYVPAVIDNPIPTPLSVHDHVCSSPVPCRDLTATTRPIQTDTNNLAQSASSNSVNQRISHIKNIPRDLPRITFGKHVFLLPPIPTTSEVNIQKSLQFQDTEGSEAHISQSDLSLQLQVQNPQPENPHSAIITPKVQLDARRSSTYISTVINQFCPKSPILAESANIKVNTSHLLLFNPQCDHISSSLTNQSAQRPSEDSYTKISKVFHSSNPASMNSSNIIQSSAVSAANIHIDLQVSQFDTFSPSSADLNPIVPRRDVPVSRYSKTSLQFPISSSICYREFIFRVFSSAAQH